MNDLDFEGLRVRCRSWGRGRPVVFLHSGGGSGAQWEKVAGALADDCRAIAPDLLGAGDTAAWPVPEALTHDLQAALVAAVIDADGDRPVDVVGHSYGGATAVRLAVNQPNKVRSLVLIEPILNCLLGEARDPLFGESERVGRAFVASIDDGRPEAAWELFIDARNGAGTWARLPDRRRQQFVATAAQGKAAMLSNLNNRTTFAECRAIAVPTTVVCGAETTAPDRRATELLRDAVPGARYELLAGSAHMSPLTHPADVARVVREHLGRVHSQPPTD
jgi:pimeloyl-ACP methyl ester carboxylesterase